MLSTIGELNHKLENLSAETVSAQTYDIQEDRYIALQVAYNLLKTELGEQNKTLLALQKREVEKMVEFSSKIFVKFYFLWR